MTERTTAVEPPHATGDGATGAAAGGTATGRAGAGRVIRGGAAAPRFGPVRRATQLVLGLLLFTFSMAMVIHSGQGNTPWDVLHEGVVRVTGLSFGWVVLITSLAVLACWIPLRQIPGVGTVANTLIISLAIDPSLSVLEWLVPDPGLLAGIPLAVTGIVLNGIATAAYIGVRLGPGTRDGLMTGLVARTGWPVWRIRTGLETVVVITGVLLGGTFGWSTVLFALAIGPVVQWSSWKWLAPRGLVG